MIIQGVPSTFSKEELLTEIIKVVTKHGVRILQPARDITFDEDQIAIIVDGVDHMALSKDPEDDLTKDEFDGASD
jgi:mannitol/fructose-specific phosphotransferase system IIA component